MSKTESMNIEKYMQGVKFPAQREEIVNCARQQGADEQVCCQLSQLPNMNYRSVNEVCRDWQKLCNESKASRN